MKSAFWLCLFFAMVAPAVSLAGDIQVSCEPGLRIYLDGEFKGISNEKEDGLVLLNVPGGIHTIQVEKDGFLPQIFEVRIPVLPIEVEVGEFTPDPAVSRPVEPRSAVVKELSGDLLVTSAPQNCTVEIDGVAEEKTTPYLSIGGLSAGEHRIVFSKEGYPSIADNFTIHPGVEITVRGNLMAGKVEVSHPGKGSLRLTSKPRKCRVWFSGAVKDTSHGRLNMSHIPAGEHQLIVTWGGREISSKVLIKNGQRTIVNVSFMKGDEPVTVSYEPD